MFGFLMLRMRFLPAEKDSRIRAPIECHFAALRIAEEGADAFHESDGPIPWKLREALPVA